MELPIEHPAEEIKRLQRCVNDLVSILALPATWTGGDRSHIGRTLIDSIASILTLDASAAKGLDLICVIALLPVLPLNSSETMIKVEMEIVDHYRWSCKISIVFI